MRQYYIDWIRVFTILAVFFLHCGRLFDDTTRILKNTETSLLIDIIDRFIELWSMPLLFMVAGYAAWYAINKRNITEYLFERMMRLLVPLIFGIIVIIPPRLYIESIIRNQFSGNYFDFYPYFFTGIFNGYFISIYTSTNNYIWYHLWFLAYLFTFSIITLPLFLYISNKRKHIPDCRAVPFFQKPLALLLYIIPLWLSLIFLQPIFPGSLNLIGDWANFLFWILLYIYGFLLAANPEFEYSIERQRIFFLWLSLVASIVGGFFILTETKITLWYQQNLWQLLRCLATWGWIMTIIGYSRKYVSFSNSILKYCSEAALPFYILHLPIIYVIGYFIIPLDLNVYLKYSFLVLISFWLTVTLYELSIKRIGVLGIAFGMKTKIIESHTSYERI